MTAVWVLLAIGQTFLGIGLAAMGLALNAARKEHAKCIAHVAHYVGDEYAAMVLLAAAHDWDSAEESSRLKVLARLKYMAGGPSMPAIWLEDRALRLRDGLGDEQEAV